jgi:flagellar basal-body rod protein FlgB
VAAILRRAAVTCITQFRPRGPAWLRTKPLSGMWHGGCSVSLARRISDGATVAINLDSYLGVHATALKLREQRTELLARNLANADTPGYKAQDLDFRAALAATTTAGDSAGTLRATQSAHIGMTGSAALEPGSTEAFLRYRTPLAPSLDGNTVDAQLEQAAFAENAVRYQATLSFLSSKFRSLMTAITGQ